MSGQRHRILRQVLEVTVRDKNEAWKLQSELSRIQSRTLEAIIDRCCTEASDPSRVYRINSLTVDLGHINPEDLERDLPARLEERLREALSAYIVEEDADSRMRGEDPEVVARLEIVAFFARTGCLPWWADASKPALLDEALGYLQARARRALVALGVELSNDLRGLRRLILHCDDKRLAALFEALAEATPGGPALGRMEELRGLLETRGAGAGVPGAKFRVSLWLSALRAACVEALGDEEALSFWRGVLGHTALDLGILYAPLVAALRESIDASGGVNEDSSNPIGLILLALEREARGEATPRAHVERAGDGDVDGAERARAQATTDGLSEEAIEEAKRLLLTALRRGDGTEAPREREAFANTSVDTAGSAKRADRGQDAGGETAEPDAATQGDEAESEERASSDNEDLDPAAALAEMEAILERMERVSCPPKALFTEIRGRMGRADARHRKVILNALRTVDAQVERHGIGAPETAKQVLRLLRRIIASKWLEDAAYERILDELDIEKDKAKRETLLIRDSEEAPETNALSADPRWIELQTAIEEARARLRAAIDEAIQQRDVTSGRRTTGGEDASTDQADTALNRIGADHAALPEEIRTILQRLEQVKCPPAALFVELHRRIARDNRRYPGDILDALRSVDARVKENGTQAPETAIAALRLLRSVIDAQWLEPSAYERMLDALHLEPSRKSLRQEPDTKGEGPLRRHEPDIKKNIIEPAQERGAERDAGLPDEERKQARALLERERERARERARAQADAASKPKAPRLDLQFADSDEVYVESSGLVILWPFIGHLFEHLGLTADRKFRDPASRHRAVGLLNYLVNEDASPPEYQLPLAKVLCGLPIAQVFEFGPPVTEEEAQECATMLEATIANAPILKDMSIDGFRGSFLIRKGVLGTRGGSWLLRVERASYDVILDRFPWGFTMVMLPWMEAPLSVEW